MSIDVVIRSLGAQGSLQLMIRLSDKTTVFQPGFVYATASGGERRNWGVISHCSNRFDRHASKLNQHFSLLPKLDGLNSL